jgi:endoglucanase
MTAFEIRRGTNISHWLSQSHARGEERRRRFSREDSTRLADLGFDHLRLPIDEEQMWAADGTRNPEAWDLLDQGIDWCEEDGMRAIIDLHILRCHHFTDTERNSLFTDPNAAAHFAECWRDLSNGLRTRSNDRVAYELLNEPVADDPDDWNRVLRAPYEVVRSEEPDRVIAVGSNRWNNVATYPDFSPPKGDRNVILVFHYYNPMLVTFHTAPFWKGLCDYKGPIQYPGRPVPEAGLKALEPQLRERIDAENQHFDISVMEKSLQPALKKAGEMNVPLWCNEFGVYKQTPDDIRKAWYRDFVSVLDKYNIPWTNWDFRGEFGLLDKHNNPTVVAEALLG